MLTHHGFEGIKSMPQPKTYFITGANSGFGHAIAVAAAREGSRVIGTVRTASAGASLEAEMPGRIHAVHLDVTDFDAIPGLVAEAERTYGPIDVLINNAGYGHEGVLEESPLEE